MLADTGGVEEVATPHGPARVHPAHVDGPRALLVLGHSAGGGVSDPALLAATRGALSVDVSTVLVELPYRVAGSKRPPPPAQADAAWLAVLAHLGSDLPLVTGGRSYGGRVACRTAAAGGSVGVVCLAFPMLPPYGDNPPSRLPELDAVAVPALVVQGDRDPYGRPPDAPGRTVVVLPGDHGLRTSLPAVTSQVAEWLDTLLIG